MSAYIVDDQLINRILSGLDYAKINSNLDYPRPYNALILETEPAELGQMLRDMNESAVKQRYPDWVTTGLPGPVDENGNTPDYIYTWEPFPKPMQLYKHLSCYLYQCSEGDVPDWTLYLILSEYKNELAHYIISSLDEYKKTEW